MAQNRLTPERLDIDPGHLDDHLTLLANNIENSLLKIGAAAGTDYTYKNLMEWAIQLSKDDMDDFKLECGKIAIRYKFQQK